MLEKFLAFIARKGLFAIEEKVILAVSGGIDSVVMSHLFFKAKLNFAIAHCNFGLRGAESDEDELFVKKLAKKYKVPFYSEYFETEAFAQEEKISIQMAARMLRYRWFEQLLYTENYNYIATAHHLNDTLETVLFNITKGTGISGLHGIQPKIGHIVRPVLFADKEEIFAYVVENQLAWREDSSNQTSKYQRNLIRNEVVPLLKQINPSLESTIHQTIEKVVAIERIFEAEMNRVKKEVCMQKNEALYIDLAQLQAEQEPLIKLHELIKPYHFSYVQAQDIWEVLQKESGRQFESPTYILVKDRNQLVITAKSIDNFISASIEAGQKEFSNDGLRLQIQLFKSGNYKIPTSADIAALDANTLQFPLKIRKWKEGDWFCPLGMNKKKKLSDFLIDEKIPLNLKSRIWVLTSGGSIVWIIGHRIDNRFKITDKTQEIVQLSIQRNM